jgi:hypothetical protein
MSKKDFMNFPKPTCSKCGKLAPINEQMSNENWIVYDVKKPCSCGGVFKMFHDEPKEKDCVNCKHAVKVAEHEYECLSETYDIETLSCFESK